MKFHMIKVLATCRLMGDGGVAMYKESKIVAHILNIIAVARTNEKEILDVF